MGWIGVQNKQIAREPLRVSQDLFIRYSDSFEFPNEPRDKDTLIS